MARGKGGGKAVRQGTPLPEIPDKLYFRIGEVARLLALPAYVLRFWEGEFPHLRPTKGGTGQRLYRRRDVEALVEVRRLLYAEGYTIPGARRFLEERSQPAAALADPESSPARSAASDHVRDDALQHLHTELRELAAALSRPARGEPLPEGRASYPGVRKRSAMSHDTPTLFAWTDEDEPSGT